MRKINYRLIISDFDGTLLRSDYTILPETVTKINEYVKNGGIFVVSTGRGLDAILPQVRSLGLKGLVSSYQGSTIADIESGALLVDGGMNQKEAYAVCKAFEEIGDFHTQIYDLHNYYVNRDDEELHLYERVTQTKGTLFSGKPSDFVQTISSPVKKINVFVKPHEKQAVYEQTQKKLGKDFYVAYSADTFVEVSPKAYTKGTALSFIAKHYQIPVEKTIAIGDNGNDLPMLLAAGKGIPVQNGDRLLKENFAAYPYSNDENAVGRIIEEYGFTGEEK